MEQLPRNHRFGVAAPIAHLYAPLTICACGIFGCTPFSFISSPPFDSAQHLLSKFTGITSSNRGRSRMFSLN